MYYHQGSHMTGSILMICSICWEKTMKIIINSSSISFRRSCMKVAVPKFSWFTKKPSNTITKNPQKSPTLDRVNCNNYGGLTISKMAITSSLFFLQILYKWNTKFWVLFLTKNIMILINIRRRCQRLFRNQVWGLHRNFSEFWMQPRLQGWKTLRIIKI